MFMNVCVNVDIHDDLVYSSIAYSSSSLFSYSFSYDEINIDQH